MHRSWNALTLAAYFTQIADRKPFFERETLTDTDCYNEYLLLRLRTREGIDLLEMAQLFGRKRTDALLCYFETDVDNRNYVRTDDRLHLTAEGLWFADGIAGDAFIDELNE
jgi:oxygen-independent coproporphyrinogen-3 oxidase